ncbi:MAG TPA: glycosyltransferase, partial [Roseiflexaceae bacterium]|nr:glycosyltransferase [Roseiflexaceae bacterium]
RRRLQALLPRAHVIKTHHPTYVELAQQSDAHTDATLREQLGLPHDCPVILFFGFVRPYKGLEYLIQAMPLARQRRPVHLLVVGEFWSSPEFYERFTRDLHVEHAVTFVNRYVPNEELKPYFDLADVVVLPYVSATQSGVAQLAFGFGKPVITTRVGGLYEVVEDGVNGLLVPPQDEQALADAITRFYDEDLAARLSQHSQQHAFSWDDLVKAVEEA